MSRPRRSLAPRPAPRRRQFPWFMPSFHGDLRLVPHDADPARTDLIIFRPTPDELRIVEEIGKACVAHGWVEQWVPLTPGAGDEGEHKVTLNVPVTELGPIVSALMQPSPAALTVIKISNGRIETASGGPEAVRAAVEAAAPVEEPKAAAPAPAPVAAATVKRATPCCPQCVPGSVAPAREVLLTFLTDAQHAQWARERAITVEGGLSGHRYRLAHRHSDLAQWQGRICMDLDDNEVVHFHDNTVPPEEEVLGAMLILQHRERWLRNEATMFAARNTRTVYKNPFGGLMDGRPDALFMESLGESLMALSQPPTRRRFTVPSLLS